MRRLLRSLVFAVGAAVCLAAAADPAPHVAVPRLATPPTLDGKIDASEWHGAVELGPFRQRYPLDGAPPSDPTIARLAFAGDALYVAIDCPQSVPIVDRITRRDRLNESDRVYVSIGARGDRRTAFEFAVNAAGQLVDRLRFNDNEVSLDWDEVWDARTQRRLDGSGWSVEIRIPLRALRFEPRDTADWDLQIRRYITQRQETDEWAPVPRTVGGEVAHYGTLTPPAGLRRPSPLQLRPYVLTFARHRDALHTHRGWDGGGNLGLDLKWHLSSSLVLDLAINPDFAQVEADQVILNLSTYEIQLPEKRPFFLEGIDTFATPLQLLYTRRIGLPVGEPVLREEPPYREALASAPEPSRILVAAKLAGTIGARFTLGLLAALVDRSTVQIDSPLGDLRRTIDPLRLYGALRLRGKLPGNLELGALVTTALRLETTALGVPLPNGTAEYLLCPSGTLVRVSARCTSSSVVGSLDARWRSPGGDYILRAQAVTTARLGGPPRRLRDGTYLRDGDIGGAALVELQKAGGAHWLFDAKYRYASRRLDYNDVGFMPRQNQHAVDLVLTHRTTAPWRFALESRSQLRYREYHDERGLLLDRGLHLTSWFRSRGFVGYFVGLFFRDRVFDDREVGDGTALEHERAYGLEAEIDTDARQPVWMVVYGSIEGRRNGWAGYAEAVFAFRALQRLDLELAPTVTYTHGEPRYVGAGERSGLPLFARLDGIGLDVTLRATFTFSPRLTLQAYAQLFVARRDYREHFRFEQPPGTIGPVVRLAALVPTTETPIDSRNGQQAALNLNLVLRWEYRLGSTLYFAYTRSQTPFLDLVSGERPRLDLGLLRRAPATDVLFVKLSHYFG